MASSHLDASAIDSWRLTFLLQLCDSGFPNGSFAHSFGLETLIEEGVVHDVATFQQLLCDWFQLQCIPFEGLSAHLAWEHAIVGDLAGLIALADVVSLSTVPEQTRRGVLNIGRRTVAELARLMPQRFLNTYAERVLAGEAKATFAIAIAVAAAELGIPREQTVTAALYSGLASMIGAAVRTVPLGQSAGQQLLCAARSWLCEMPSYQGYTADDLSCASPLWEIAQMNHQHLDGRLFMS